MDIENIKKDFPPFEGKQHKSCIDLTNQKFGRLTVLYRYKENTPQNQALWVCQCDCGTVKPIRGSSLRNGKATSCGCLTYENASKSNINDLTNKRFGKLTVIEDTKKRIRHRVVWLCQCDCGRQVERLSDTLIQNDSLSCGYCNQSKGNIEIEKILIENNIKYEREKTFPNFVGKNNVPYRYDFYLPQYNRLVEYDGIQHFKKRDIFKDSLEKIQERDLLKNKFALEHNIELVRIPYWKQNSITIENILNNKYLVEE